MSFAPPRRDRSMLARELAKEVGAHILLAGGVVERETILMKLNEMLRKTHESSCEKDAISESAITATSHPHQAEATFRVALRSILRALNSRVSMGRLEESKIPEIISTCQHARGLDDVIDRYLNALTCRLLKAREKASITPPPTPSQRPGVKTEMAPLTMPKRGRDCYDKPLAVPRLVVHKPRRKSRASSEGKSATSTGRGRPLGSHSRPRRSGDVHGDQPKAHVWAAHYVQYRELRVQEVRRACATAERENTVRIQHHQRVKDRIASPQTTAVVGGITTERTPSVSSTMITRAQEGGTSLGMPEEGGTSLGMPEEGGTSLGIPEEEGTSLGRLEEEGTSLGIPEEEGTSLGRLEEEGTSLGIPEEEGTSLGIPEEEGTSLGRLEEEGTSLGRTQEGGTSLGIPEEEGTSVAMPEEGDTSLGMPQEGDTSLGMLEEGGTSVGMPVENSRPSSPREGSPVMSQSEQLPSGGLAVTEGVHTPPQLVSMPLVVGLSRLPQSNVDAIGAADERQVSNNRQVPKSVHPKGPTHKAGPRRSHVARKTLNSVYCHYASRFFIDSLSKSLKRSSRGKKFGNRAVEFSPRGPAARPFLKESLEADHNPRGSLEMRRKSPPVCSVQADDYSCETTSDSENHIFSASKVNLRSALSNHLESDVVATPVSSSSGEFSSEEGPGDTGHLGGQPGNATSKKPESVFSNFGSSMAALASNFMESVAISESLHRGETRAPTQAGSQGSGGDQGDSVLVSQIPASVTAAREAMQSSNYSTTPDCLINPPQNDSCGQKEIRDGVPHEKGMRLDSKYEDPVGLAESTVDMRATEPPGAEPKRDSLSTKSDNFSMATLNAPSQGGSHIISKSLSGVVPMVNARASRIGASSSRKNAHSNKTSVGAPLATGTPQHCDSDYDSPLRQ